MNMMNPRGKDLVLLIQSSKGCVKAEMESNDYIVVRSLRHKSADHGGPCGYTSNTRKQGLLQESFAKKVTVKLNHKGWVGVGRKLGVNGQGAS